MRCALLIIDMLNEFVKGRLALQGSEELVSRIASLAGKAREAGVPVIYLCDSHLKDVDFELKLWGPHALKGEEGSKIVDGLSPKEGDYIIEKRRYDGFFGTDLDILLRELGVDEVVLTGVATDICVLHTAAGAFFRGYKIAVVEDATSATKPERQRLFLEYMREVYGAEILSSQEAIRRMGGDPRDGAGKGS